MADMMINVKFVKEVQKYPCLYNVDIPAYSRRDLTEEAWTQIGKTMTMTAIACKDKWRNLRVVFIRHLKQLANTDKKKKPYYLFDEMRFLIPYLKCNFPTSKDLVVESTISTVQRHVSTTGIDSNESYKDIHFLNNEVIDENNIKYEIDDSNSDVYNENEHNQMSQIRKRSRDETDAQNSDFKKNARLDTLLNDSAASQMNDPLQLFNNSKNIRSELPTTDYVNQNTDPVVSFLNSILPELNEMNWKQFKLFKRRVLSLIDDITPDD